jgi:hypothetical protein
MGVLFTNEEVFLSLIDAKRKVIRITSKDEMFSWVFDCKFFRKHFGYESPVFYDIVDQDDDIEYYGFRTRRGWGLEYEGKVFRTKKLVFSYSKGYDYPFAFSF